MKDSFFSKIRSGIKNVVTFENDNDYYGDDEYEEDDEPMMEEETPASDPEPKKYTPAPEYHTPDYVPYGTQYSAPQQQPPKASGSSKFKSSEKSNANIYAMPDMKKSSKLKISLFVLNDTDDARNVADSMIDRGIVVICDMSKISVAEERRVLDFLDGVKYVCNSIIESIADHIYLIVPEAAELSGDFFSQVDY